MVSLTARLGLLPAVKIGNLITAGLEKVTKKKYGRQTTKELASTKAGKVLGIGTTAVAAATAVALNPSLAARALGSLIPKSAVGKGAALLVGGAAVASPVIRKAVVETPSVIFEKGEALGKEIEKQKSEGGATSKTTTGLIIGAAAGLLVPPLLKKGKDAVTGKLETLPTPSLPTDKIPSAGDFFGSPELTPQTPATQEMTPKRKKRLKKAKEAQRQTITQRVDVRVGVNAGNKKYIRNVYVK